MSQPEQKRRRRVPVIRRSRPPGTMPGTLVVPATAPKPVITVIGYGPEGCEEACVSDLEALAELRAKWRVIWVNIDGLGDVDLLRNIGESFGLHRLALEDVVNVHQRAKLEPYDDHLFIVARMVHFEEHLSTEQVSLFVGDNYVLTFQERVGDSFDLVRQRLRSGRGILRQSGPGYLAYTLLDALIDAYFPVLETFGEQIERLEDEVIEQPTQSLVGRIHVLRRELLVLRRAIWPHREAVNALLRDDSPLISEETRLYLRDCYDHTIQLLDIVETYRELGSGLLDVYLSSVSNRMNEVMKVLTIFAAIFIPLTFVAGLYGMNFEHMPELRWAWSYPLLLLIMLVMAAAMLVYFRRRGWLGQGGRSEDPPS